MLGWIRWVLERKFGIDIFDRARSRIRSRGSGEIYDGVKIQSAATRDISLGETRLRCHFDAGRFRTRIQGKNDAASKKRIPKELCKGTANARLKTSNIPPSFPCISLMLNTHVPIKRQFYTQSKQTQQIAFTSASNAINGYIRCKRSLRAFN